MRCILALKVTSFLKDKMFIFAEGPSFWTKKNELLVEVFFTFCVSFFFSTENFNANDVQLVGKKSTNGLWFTSAKQLRQWENFYLLCSEVKCLDKGKFCSRFVEREGAVTCWRFYRNNRSSTSFFSFRSLAWSGWKGKKKQGKHRSSKNCSGVEVFKENVQKTFTCVTSVCLPGFCSQKSFKHLVYSLAFFCSNKKHVRGVEMIWKKTTYLHLQFCFHLSTILAVNAKTTSCLNVQKISSDRQLMHKVSGSARARGGDSSLETRRIECIKGRWIHV